jgi:outer membrane protein OmpA-like peptidoglycan-associated protein/Tol biopolymer transport system component
LAVTFIITACAQRGQGYTTRKKSAIAAFEEAQSALRILNYTKAHEQLQKAIDADPKFVEAWLLKGSLYAEQKQPANAADAWREAMSINPRIRTSTWIDIAKMELLSARYTQALSAIDAFEQSEQGNIPPPLLEKLRLMRNKAEFGEHAIAHPVPYQPFNLGKNVNTPFDEYHPSLTVDGRQLVFTAREPKGTGPSGQPVLREDIYIARLGEKEWQVAKNIGAPVNTPRYNEGSSSISPDGRWLFFTACHTEGGEGSCDLFYSRRSGGIWSKPVGVGAPVNSGAWESHPVMSTDGRTLYFTSNRKGGKGGMDIWMSQKGGDSQWSNPVSMPFNTPGDEMTPFIHPDDSSFYFASDYLIGMGGHDMFVVRRQGDGMWSTPKNLGYPINTEKDEHGLIVDPQGKLAFYATDRAGGAGGLDIYGFPLYSEVSPAEVFFLEGIVQDAQTGQKLEARFELKDPEVGNTVVQSYSDAADGSFLVPLPGRRNFALHVQKEGYLFFSQSFFFKGNSATPQRIDVRLQPIREGATVVLQNIFFATGKYELEAASQAELATLLGLLNDNPDLRIEIGGHTDNVGSAADNKSLSENRARSVYQFLLSKGVAANRLSFKGYGPDIPIADNSTPEGRAKNRRTEFKVVR